MSFTPSLGRFSSWKKWKWAWESPTLGADTKLWRSLKFLSDGSSWDQLEVHLGRTRRNASVSPSPTPPPSLKTSSWTYSAVSGSSPASPSTRSLLRTFPTGLSLAPGWVTVLPALDTRSAPLTCLPRPPEQANPLAPQLRPVRGGAAKAGQSRESDWSTEV